MTNEQTIESIMKSARARITSENATHVTVARMPAEEVAALLDEIERLKAQLADLMPLYEKPQPAAEPARPEPVEWIKWAGGQQPVPDGVLCKTRLEDGDEGARLAENWVWEHDEFGANIVAYRVLP